MRPMLAVLALAAVAAPRHADRFSAEDVLTRSLAAYAALQSYADSGGVVGEGAGREDRFAFRTYFTRDPRNLLLNFRFLGNLYLTGNRWVPGDHRIVIWMEEGEMQSWDSKAEAHQTYPSGGGRQVKALTGAAYNTVGVSTLIPSLLYSKADIVSAVRATEEPVEAGTETIGGRKCYKVMGVERYRYPSGQVTGVRPITLWIDAETYLLRKIFQDTPKGYARGSMLRRTTTFHPQANPRLDSKLFHYEVPEP
jgi:hypothetical protein